MNTYKSESNSIPIPIDTTNRDIVFVNENVTEVAATEDKPLSYAYDVKEYTKEEYASLRFETLETDVDEIVTALGIIEGVTV